MRRWSPAAVSRRLLADSGSTETFRPDALGDLAEPVRAYLGRAVAPGTPLASGVRLAIRGSIALGGRWLGFRSREVLVPGRGLVWWGRVAGVVFGGDFAIGEEGAMDWRLLGVRTVAHARGRDVARSGQARAIAEGSLWAPTAMLPSAGVSWRATGDRTIVATARSPVGEDVVQRITLDDDDRVRSAVFDRWGDPDQTGAWAHHPFGGEVSAWATFGGVTIASEGRVGWHFGTARWPEGEFFRYEVTDCELLA